MPQLEQIYIYRIPTKIIETLKPVNANTVDPHAPGTSRLEDDKSDEEAEDDFDEAQEASRLSQALADASLDVIARPAPGSPVTWFSSGAVSDTTKLGIYSAMIPSASTTLASLQLPRTEAGVEVQERSIGMFMVGGGHFQGTIISLTDSTVSKCAIRASKGFHRYTTRRKQGGAQSANDNAKGAANSAGAQIRRYNEIALAEDVRALLKEWRAMLENVELILVRASGPSSKKLLFDNGLDKTDARIRGFPLNTYRATQAEIIRSFHTLTRLQVGSTEDDEPAQKPVKTSEVKEVPVSQPEEKKADPALVAHTTQLLALIKRQKLPALKTYLVEHELDAATFVLEPAKAHRHTPTLLHHASTAGADKVVGILLDAGADPTQANAEGQTAFELAGERETRDAFRLWRGASPAHEGAWDWDAARVPAALTVAQVQARKEREAAEREQVAAVEDERRKVELERIRREAAEEAERERAELDRRRGPARTLAVGVMGGSAATSLEGLTPQMRQKIERERRARAAEARMAKK